MDQGYCYFGIAITFSLGNTVKKGPKFQLILRIYDLPFSSNIGEAIPTSEGSYRLRNVFTDCDFYFSLSLIKVLQIFRFKAKEKKSTIGKQQVTAP